MSRKRVLVVEDDDAIRQGLADALRFAEYEVLEASRGDRAMEMVSRAALDVVLLDLVLPGAGGLEVLQHLRRQQPALPAIILTAKGEEADRVRGLRLGADDYVIKPFSVRELLARVEAVLRRSPERPVPVSGLELPGGHADLARCEVVFADGGRRDLSEREVDLLRYLASHRGRVVSRDELLLRVWRVEPRGVETRTIDMLVARLREKLRDDPSRPAVLLTVRGKGYMLASIAGG
jgi:DNA-binding response OmpR family regulator